MMIKLKGAVIFIYADYAEDRCCGESRSDWRLVGEVRLDSLVKALQKFVTGKSTTEIL